VVRSVSVVLRERARADIAETVDWYRDHADVATALRFVEALESALRKMARHPAAGSPCYALALDLPGLRSWPLSGFPYIVFYVERSDHDDVWRVLHGHRDVPASLVEDDTSS
jgi:toxin ParE1/3/4